MLKEKQSISPIISINLSPRNVTRRTAVVLCNTSKPRKDMITGNGHNKPYIEFELGWEKI